MSSDSVNAETLEQTKQQIRGLVAEIAQISKGDLGPEEYYPAFLQRVVQALAAVGGAIWILGEGRRLRLQYQINLSQPLLEGTSDDANRHLNLLRYTLGARRAQLVPPLSGAENEDMGANPTRYLLVLAPISADDEPQGLVEIFQRPDAQPATQRGYERFLVQMCELASEWLKSQKLRHFSDRHSLWAQADHFSRLVHESLDLRETSYTIVNEGRRMIGCDRVSLAQRRGRKCVVDAVSGQDTVESRSNVITSLNELASKVIATGEALWYDGSTENLPPQLEKAIHKYVDESYAKSLIVLPLRRPKTIDSRLAEQRRHEASSERNESNEIIGALIVEQIETDLPREILTPRVDLVYEHSARALSNAVAHNSLFLMPVWRTLGKTSWVVKARNLPKTLTALLILVIAIVVLFLIPVKFKLVADGTLEPTIKKDVFVNVPGTVFDVKVKDGDEVNEGQVLVETRNAELAVGLQKLLGEKATTDERLDVIRRRAPTLEPDERVKLLSESLELKGSLESLDRQIALRQQQIEELKIRAPMSGRVMLSWDVERSLLRRKVEAGQMIMSIADLNGDWELELLMPERRMGHVNRERHKALEKGSDLNVDYILATDARNRFHGAVKYVDQVTRVNSEAGHSVLIRADIREADLADSNLRPGAKVHARVECGRSSLGYRFFHEAIAWVQTKLLF